MKQVAALVRKPWFIFAVYILVSLVALAIKYQVETLNNFKIFRTSYFHLRDLGRIYGEFLPDHRDVYIYGPPFAVLIAPISLLPFIPGAIAWVLLCTIIYFVAVNKLPLPQSSRNFILWFSLIELVTTIQNVQANSITAALMLFTFINLEKGKPFWAGLFVALAALTKVYGAIALSLYILYPDKIKNGLYFIFWMIVLMALPLLVVDFSTCVRLYKDWFDILSMKHDIDSGISIVGIFRKFDPSFPKYPVQFIGILLFLTGLIRYRQYHHIWFRYLLLASCMIWVIIFNHASESNTYIIAVTGACIWYQIQPKSKWLNAVMIFCFILTVLSPTDIFPPSFRKNVLQAWCLKAVPCILIWICIWWQQLRADGKEFVSGPLSQ
jgi:hypothetical protein